MRVRACVFGQKKNGALRSIIIVSPPEFTDVSAIITPDRAFVLPARINRRVQWNEGKRKGERKIVESAPWRREDVTGKGKQKRKRLETPRDLIRLVGKIHAVQLAAARRGDTYTGNGPSVGR